MNPTFKSFFKRDPFEFLLILLNGLHEDFNSAPKKGLIAPANDSPAFDYHGIVELDYI